MKKLFTLLIAVTLVFSLASMASATDEDLKAKLQHPAEEMQFVPSGLQYMLFIPHYDVTPGQWWSGLVVQNLSAGANQCIIWIQNDNGYTTGYIEEAFTGFGKETMLLDVSATGGATTGYIILESQLPMTAFINFGQIGGGFTSLGPFQSYQVY